MKGTYQHCGKPAFAPLSSYLAEFDFRYNHRIALGIDDAERVNKVLTGIVGKRLTYRRPDTQKIESHQWVRQLIELKEIVDYND